ncbi:LptA/OstA family protein, partial [Xanthomonas citri pv. citri]
IRLLADKATYSERSGVTSYTGNVTITQGTLKMAADNLTVNLRQPAPSKVQSQQGVLPLSNKL